MRSVYLVENKVKTSFLEAFILINARKMQRICKEFAKKMQRIGKIQTNSDKQK
jgi:hypothetical protein